MVRIHHGPPPPNQWSRSLAQPVGRWFALAALGSGLRPSGFGVRRGEAVLRLIRLTHHGPTPPNQWSRSLAQPLGRWFALAAGGSGQIGRGPFRGNVWQNVSSQGVAG